MVKVRWKVHMKVSRVVEVIVDVEPDSFDDTYGNAGEDAERAVRKQLGVEKAIWSVERNGAPMQLGEPWVYCGGWEDDLNQAPASLICIDRACGNQFTAEDIVLLKNRLGELGYKPTASWSYGEGCGQVSIMADGRVGKKQMTSLELKKLLAPRGRLRIL